MKDLDELKRQASMVSKRKEFEKAMDLNNLDTVRATDSMLVLHEQELDTLEHVFYKALEDWKDLEPSHQRNILNILNMLGDDTNE